jgi:hypothetical protein
MKLNDERRSTLLNFRYSSLTSVEYPLMRPVLYFSSIMIRYLLLVVETLLWLLYLLILLDRLKYEYRDTYNNCFSFSHSADLSGPACLGLGQWVNPELYIPTMHSLIDAGSTTGQSERYGCAVPQ